MLSTELHCHSFVTHIVTIEDKHISYPLVGRDRLKGLDIDGKNNTKINLGKKNVMEMRIGRSRKPRIRP
jgi:hypothetical protein